MIKNPVATQPEVCGQAQTGGSDTLMLWLYQDKTARVLGFCQAGGTSMIYLLANESPPIHRIILLYKSIYLLNPGHQSSQSRPPSLSSVKYCSREPCLPGVGDEELVVAAVSVSPFQSHWSAW